MNLLIKYLFFLFLFISIGYKEISCLPHPVNFFRLVYNPNATALQFYLWAFWVFVLVPIGYILLHVIWSIKYCLVEPRQIQKLTKQLCMCYSLTLLISLSIVLLFFYLNHCSGLVTYIFIRFARIAPAEFVSNIYTIELCLVSSMMILVVFGYITYHSIEIALNKSGNPADANRFIAKNWSFLYGFGAFLGFYLLNALYILFKTSSLNKSAHQTYSYEIFKMDMFLALLLMIEVIKMIPSLLMD